MTPTPNDQNKQQRNQNMPAKTLGGTPAQQPPAQAAPTQQPQQAPSTPATPQAGQQNPPAQAQQGRSYYGEQPQATEQSSAAPAKQWAPATFPGQSPSPSQVPAANSRGYMQQSQTGPLTPGASPWTGALQQAQAAMQPPAPQQQAQGIEPLSRQGESSSPWIGALQNAQSAIQSQPPTTGNGNPHAGMPSFESIAQSMPSGGLPSWASNLPPTPTDSIEEPVAAQSRQNRRKYYGEESDLQ